MPCLDRTPLCFLSVCLSVFFLYITCHMGIFVPFFLSFVSFGSVLRFCPAFRCSAVVCLDEQHFEIGEECPGRECKEKTSRHHLPALLEFLQAVCKHEKAEDKTKDRTKD